MGTQATKRMDLGLTPRFLNQRHFLGFFSASGLQPRASLAFPLPRHGLVVLPAVIYLQVPNQQSRGYFSMG